MAYKKTLFCGTNSQYLKEELTKEANEANGGVAFRIPSLVNANGTLVAAIDKAYTGADWGFIEIGVRTSKDGGKTWSNIKTIATPPARIINSDMNNTATAFYIDPCMTVAPNGDVVMLVTYYPESKGLFSKEMLDKNKIAYSTFNGEVCPLIYDRDGNFYYILKDDTVIDINKKPTNYKVNFVDGELYKGDEYIGNIHLNGAIGKSDADKKTTFGAPLKSVRRSYIFMLRSSDNGETWSKPVDITGSVLKQDTDGYFLGIAPGNALTTSSGRMIFPCYTIAKGSVCIYSDDNGMTWRRNLKAPYTPNIDEWTLIEAPNGDLVSFSRAKLYGKTPMAISKDNGLVWTKEKKAPFKAPKCQKNAITFGNKVLVSHPSKNGRNDGVISVGEFEYKKDKYKGIKWSKDDIEINKGFFAYSCMAKIDDNTVGILYEDQPGSHIIFETIEI